MTITHDACLELLAQRPGLSNSELARGAFVTRQSMNVLLQALEAKDSLSVRPRRASVGPADRADRPWAPPTEVGQRRGSPRRARHARRSGCQRTRSVPRLLRACIASLTEPAASASLTPMKP